MKNTYIIIAAAVVAFVIGILVVPTDKIGYYDTEIAKLELELKQVQGSCIADSKIIEAEIDKLEAQKQKYIINK